MFPGPDSMGFVWGGLGRALVQFMRVLATFAMLAVPTLRGVIGDVVTVYAY